MLCESRWKCFLFSCVELIDRKIARPTRTSKSNQLQAISRHTVSFIINAFENKCEFSLKVLSINIDVGQPALDGKSDQVLYYFMANRNI